MALSLMLRNTIKLPGRVPCLQAFGIIPLQNNFSQSSCRILSTFGKQNVLTPMNMNTEKLGVRYFGSKTDFRLMWTIERLLSLSLVGLIPATVAYPSPILNNACAVIVGLHLHWGLEAVCQDYIRPIVFGSFIPKVAGVATYAVSILIISGLLYFNYNDVGIGNGIRKLWAIKE